MPARENNWTIRALTGGGAGVEVLGGLAAIILTILGLVNVVPGYMVSIAAIVIGGSMLVTGMAGAAEFSQVASSDRTAAELGGGVSLEVLGGITAVVLGILSLLNVQPEILLPIAAIVVGASLMFSANVPKNLADLRSETFAESETFGSSSIAGSVAGTQMMTGIATLVLGLLALVGLAPLILTLVAFLAAAVSLLLSGFAAGGTVAMPER